ncbi:MAG: hypothetical protein FWE80_07210, partial [Oscillospiraceae bacterium]|nr:hypothetical protein [Oscillospiraceae bacterium]
MARIHVAHSKSAKKKIAALIAIVLTLALLIGGVFAWSDFGQRIQNIFNYAPTPDVLLHDDFTANVNKDVYVENTGVVPLFVRVQFAEFMQIGNDAMTNTGVKGDPETWPVHLHGPNAPDEDGVVSEWDLLNDRFKTCDYYEWYLTGGRKVYLPGTSEIADKTYEDSLVGTPGPNGQDYAETMPATPVVLMSDVLAIIANDGVPGNADEITIWNAFKAGCWVLDDTQDMSKPWEADGWAYWSQPLAPGTATNLLLDNVLPVKTPDDNMFYGIDVRLQATNYTELHEFGDIPPLWDFVNYQKNNATKLYIPMDTAKQFVPTITGKDDGSWVWSISPKLPGCSISSTGEVTVGVSGANFGKTFTVKYVNSENPNNYETWECEVVLPVTATYFPDEMFRDKFAGETAEKRITDDSFFRKVEADEVKSVDVTRAHHEEEIAGHNEIVYDEDAIFNIIGIEYFVNLDRFTAERNEITSVDVSKNTKLTYLNLSHNDLSDLDLSNNLLLKELHAADNHLPSMDLSPYKYLTDIVLQDNQMTSLNVTGLTNLYYFNCSANKIEALDIRTCTALELFYAFDNKLTTIDVSLNWELRELCVNDNDFVGALDIRANKKLQKLECRDSITLTAILMGVTDGYYPNLYRIEAQRNAIEELNIRGTAIISESMDLILRDNNML